LEQRLIDFFRNFLQNKKNMEESPLAPVTRIRLESLSTDELIKIADTYGVDIPPELERIFIIEEILEAVNSAIENPEDPIEVNPSYSEAVLLPKQYNISYIEVIIRDPLWVFVFWEIKSHDRETHENANDFKGYFLRIIPLNKDGKEIKSKEDTFTVLISREDNARYLGFTGEKSFTDNEAEERTAFFGGKKSGGTQNDLNEIQQANYYKIKLGVTRGGNEIVIASSAPFFLPALCDNERIISLSRNPLLRLSGVQDLSLVRNTDRQARVKR